MPNPIDEAAAILGRGGPFDRVAQELCSWLRRTFPHYPWVGVYRIEGKDTLVLRAWDGPRPTEHVRIPVGRGICGLAAREARSVVVDDVSRDPRYLQCFLTTKSEIVVPIFREGKVVGEIDVDGDREAAFNAVDRAFLEWCAEKLGRIGP